MVDEAKRMERGTSWVLHTNDPVSRVRGPRNQADTSPIRARLQRNPFEVSGVFRAIPFGRRCTRFLGRNRLHSARTTFHHMDKIYDLRSAVGLLAWGFCELDRVRRREMSDMRQTIWGDQPIWRRCPRCGLAQAGYLKFSSTYAGYARSHPSETLSMNCPGCQRVFEVSQDATEWIQGPWCVWRPLPNPDLPPMISRLIPHPHQNRTSFRPSNDC